MAEVGENPRLKLYKTLVSSKDPEVRSHFGKIKPEVFDQKLATDKDFQESLFMDLQDLGMAKDSAEFYNQYTAPKPPAAAQAAAPKAPQPLAAEEPQKKSSGLFDITLGLGPGLINAAKGLYETGKQMIGVKSETAKNEELQKKSLNQSATGFGGGDNSLYEYEKSAKEFADADRKRRVMEHKLGLDKKKTGTTLREELAGTFGVTPPTQLPKEFQAEYNQKKQKHQQALDKNTGLMKKIVDDLANIATSKEADQAYRIDNQGIKIPNQEYVTKKAREAASKYGAPEKGYTTNFINTSLRAALDFKLHENEVKPLASEVYGQINSWSPKTLKELTDVANFPKPKQGKTFEETVAEDFQKGIVSAGEMSVKAKMAYKAAMQIADKEYKPKVELATKEWTSALSKYRANLATDPNIKTFVAEYDAKALAPLQKAVNEGKMSVEEANKLYTSKESLDVRNTAINEYINSTDYGKGIAASYDKYLTDVSDLNNRYNARSRRQADEIEKHYKSLYDQIISEAKKKYNVPKHIVDKYAEAFQIAQGIVQKKYANKREAADLDAGIFENFISTTMKGLGEGIQSTAFTLGLEDVSEFGRLLADNFQTSDLNINKWSDVGIGREGRTRFAMSAGNILGRMAPGLAASAGVAMATGGAGLPLLPSMFLSAVPSAAFETADIMGSVSQQVLAQGGDIAKARDAQSKALDGQLKIWPTYLLDGLPFFPKLLKGIKPFKSGLANSVLRGGAAAGIDLVTETAQEVPQNIFEEVILAGKEPTIAELYNNLTLAKIKNTSASVASISLLMGGAPQVYAGTRDAIAKQAAKSYYAKQILNQASHPALATQNQVQFLTQLADQKSPRFAAQMVNVLLQKGNIDKARASVLAKKLENYNQFVESMGASKSPVIKEQMLNPIVRQAAFLLYDKFIQARNSKNAESEKAALDTFNNFLIRGQGADLIMLRMPGGDYNVYTYDDFNSLMDDTDFQEAARQGDSEYNGVFEITLFAQTQEQLNNPKLKQILDRFEIIKNSEPEDTTITDEEEDITEDQADIDEKIRQGQERTGFTFEGAIAQMPEDYRAVLDAVRSGERDVTIEEIEQTMRYMDGILRTYEKMPGLSARNLTMDQIQAASEELESALTDLNRYAANMSFDEEDQAADEAASNAAPEPPGPPALPTEEQVIANERAGEYENLVFGVNEELPDYLKPYSGRSVRFKQNGEEFVQLTVPASLAQYHNQSQTSEAPATEQGAPTQEAPAEEPAPAPEAPPAPKPKARVKLFSKEEVIASFDQKQKDLYEEYLFDGDQRSADKMIEAQRARLINKELELAGVGTISEQVRKSFAEAGIDVQLLSAEEFEKMLKEAGQPASRLVEGMFDDEKGNIYINKDAATGKGWGTTIVWHEASHPIINIIRNSNKPLYDKLIKGILAGAKANPEGKLADIKRWAEKEYASYTQEEQYDEMIVETLGQLASGRMSFRDLQPGLRQRFMDLINRMARILGFATEDTGDIAALKNLSKKITETIKAGKGLSEIVGAENVGKFKRTGPMTARMAASLSRETQDKVVAGQAVGTRKPSAKKSPDLAYNKDLLIGLEATKASPILYKFNAVLVASYDIMYPVLPPTIKTYLNGIYKTLNKYQNEVDTLRDEIDAAKKEIVNITAKQEKLKKTEAAKLTTRIIAGEVKRGGYGRLITDLRKKIDRLEQLTQKDGLLSKERERVRKEIEKYAKEKMTMQMADRIYKEFIGITQSNLEALVNLFPARLREVAKLWYDGANLIAQDFAKKYKTSIEQAAAVLAVFSPQKDWFMNISLAERLMNIYNNMMDYKFDDAMASKYLKRAGEPELTIDEKTGEEKWTGGAVPLLDEDGEHVEIDGVLQFKNWDNEKAKARIDDAAKTLKSLRGKSLRELLDAGQLDKAARFVRMYSEVYDSPNFSFYTPSGERGYESRSEKGTLRKIAWGGYNTIEKALKIMEATEKNKMDVIHNELGEMHKVRSFYNNIADPLSKEGHVTMDTHAIAAILWKALSGASFEVTQNFGGAGTKSEAAIGSNGLYPVFAEAYREAANNLGYLPREIQSITWEAVRMLFKAKWKGNKENVKKIGNIWAKFRNGELTIKQAREQIWSLATAGARGTIEEAIRNGEGVGSPDWAEILDSGLDPERVRKANDAVRLSMAGGVRYDGERGVGRPGDVTGTAGVVSGPAEGGKPGGVELSPQLSKGQREKTQEDEKVQRGRSEQAGDRGGRSEGRAIAPLSGAPNVPGASGPDPGLVSVAEKYAKEKGIDLRRQAEYVELDEDRAVRLANAYEEMPHAPEDPKVKEAYADLIRQTKDQFNALSDAGYTFTFFDRDTDPYDAKPWRAMKDLRNNKTMAVYGTYDGYGTEGVTGAMIENNPMLEDTGLRWPDQKGVMHPVTANDLFRAVHDAFGHGLEGAGFRARGEENAWQAHVRLFTGPAVAAITSETRGQNSWLNYGPLGEKNRTADLANTDFALQKTGLMPEWTWTEGRAADMAPSGMQPSLGGRMSGTVLVDKEGNKLAKRGEQFTVEQLVSDINHPIYGPIFKHYAGKNKLIVLFGGRGDSEGIARWSLASKDIKFNVNHSQYKTMFGDQESLDYIVAHEIIHSIVDEYIRKDESAFNSFNKELSELKEILLEQDTQGLSPKLKEYLEYIKVGQPEELIAYSLTDPEVAAYFNSIKVSDSPGAKTVWNRIVDAILKIVNQATSNKSLLNAVTETFNKYSKEFTAKQASLGGRPSAPTFAELDEILDMSPVKSRAAREKLIEQYGKETVDRMIEISRNFTKIINGLEEQGVVEKDCP